MHPTRVKRILIWLLVGIASIGVLGFLWMLSMLGDLRVFVPHASRLTGLFGGEKRYLLVLQNNEEARPTGGFVTAFGFLDFKGGFPGALAFADVYSLQGYRDENVRPMPAPMEFFFDDPFFRGYSFHDGNWSPDFPSSAQEMIRLYQEDEENISMDGVIAVNFGFFEELLELVGGVTIDGVHYTRENFFTLVEFEVNNMDRHNVEALAGRKNVLAQVQQQVLRKMKYNPFLWGRLSRLATDGLNRKEIQLYFADPVLASLAKGRHWDGSFWQDLETQPRDIFSVNVANLGAGKSDRYVKKSYTYDVRIEDTDSGPKATARVNLVFRHLGDQNIPVSFHYRAWVRTYLPKGTVLTSDAKGVTRETEFGHTVLGQMVDVDPGKVAYISYEVELPNWIVLDRDQYKLYVNNQSGSNGEYSLSVHFPQDGLVTSEDMETVDNIAYYDGEIVGDRVFTVQYYGDQLPPRVSMQRFEDINTLRIDFNETIPQELCIPEHFTLRDLDVHVPEVTNTDIRFREVRCNGREITLLTRGITAQKEEHFALTMTGITDRAGNPMDPAEKTITVVQRF